MNDPLTDLLDRKSFLDVLGSEIERIKSDKVPLALILIDIKHFSLINKKFGFAMGDKVLIAVAQKLMEVKRDIDFVGRIDGNKFGMILSQITNKGHSELAAFKIHRLLTIPIEIEEYSVVCESHIGISISPEHGTSIEHLLSAAEEALEKAKKDSEPVEVFVQKDPLEIADNWDIELELEGSIERSELFTIFQPIISLRTGKPMGAEAQLRWKSPSRGVITPDKFLPVAEEIGFLKPMTAWLLNSALRQSSMWPTKFGKLVVGVNMPDVMVEQPDFLDIIESAEKLWVRNEVDLNLEVSELAFCHQSEGRRNLFRELRAKGISISINNFGTGPINISHFRDIAADIIKIDRSYSFQLFNNSVNEALVNLMIELAHTSKMTVVAKSIEDKQTLLIFKKYGCDAIQGKAVAKPMMNKNLLIWMKNFK